MKKVFEEKGLTAVYNSDQKRIEFVVEGYLDIERAKEMYKAVFEFMQSNPVVSFFSPFIFPC